MTKAAIQKLMINIGMAVPVALLLVLLYGTPSNGYGITYTLLLTAALTLAIGYARSRVAAGYEKRINAEAPLNWEVKVNGVAVGHLSDADYAKLQKRVHQEPAVAVAQGKNFLKVAMNVFSMYLTAIPLALFWGSVLMLVISPESVQEVAAQMVQADTTQLTAGLTSTLQTLTILLVISMVGVAPIFGQRFGAQDEYRKAVGELIRAHCKTPAEGRIDLFNYGPATGSEASLPPAN
ncbi:hypothetical protein N5D09_02955 [Stutzerimonas stutzeri]|uniref:MotA/TolQ/ExbB proton channel domain-containing protein n=1 Tax=Stutzerimonas stutzeri TaxID=316 RepID=A0ABD4XVZ8_STUST|nr:hypothetical protein [Stutzerimonas stutzeri]MDH0687046.1 hypothetical protein [Stutzerimonas stutzeri]